MAAAGWFLVSFFVVFAVSFSALRYVHMRKSLRLSQARVEYLESINRAMAESMIAVQQLNAILSSENRIDRETQARVWARRQPKASAARFH